MNKQRRIPIFWILIVHLTLLSLWNTPILAQNFDSASINKLIKEANDSVYNNPDKSINLAGQAATAANKINYPKGIALALDIEGYAHAVEGKPKEAMDLYKRALVIAGNNNLQKISGTINTDIALLYSNNGDYINALKANQMAAMIFNLLADSIRMARSYANMGSNNHYMGNYSAAISLLLHAKKIASENKAHAFTGELLNSVASNYIMLKEYPAALAYLKDAMVYLDSGKAGHEKCFLNLGTCYDKMNQPDSALYYTRLALHVFKETKNTKNEIHALINLGDMHLKQKHYDSAFTYFSKSYELSQKTEYNFGLESSYKNLASVYATKNDYKKAYELTIKSQILHDSSVNEEKVKALTELSAKFEQKETEQKNQLLLKEVAVQQLTIQRKNLMLYGSLVLLLVLAAGTMLSFRHNRLLSEQKLMRLEQQQLQAQMNPHFMYNALNAIQQFIVLHDIANANKYLADFALLMRQTLDNSKDGNITLKREIEYLSNYLSFEHLRFEDKFEFELIFDPNSDIMNIEIPAMIIQPFVENAIKHGLCNLVDSKGYLQIEFYKSSTFLCCEIDDNGIGMAKSQQLKANQFIKHQSHGIDLTRKRLELVSKMKNKEYHIEIINKDEAENQTTGTTIIIKFPLES